ncbi:MAG: DegV family EDD domain-containing protein [Chloroflexi bacterium]|nr:DegV family EDD domain-containing protein [Chloroflexota bacterium]
MPAIAIITDTDSSLPAGVAARYGIHQVPINVHFGDEVLATGIDIDDAQLFARVDREGKLPTTSAPAPGQFAEAYQAAFDAGADAVVCFCVSGEVSGTYNAAVVARDMTPERDITVMDSRQLSMGQHSEHQADPHHPRRQARPARKGAHAQAGPGPGDRTDRRRRAGADHRAPGHRPRLRGGRGAGL